MKIAIRKESDETLYIDKCLRDGIKYTEAPYNFTIVDIDDKYSDCICTDFNEELQFDIVKYTERKNREDATKRIIELKANLTATDYKAIKFAEGLITAEEYETIKQQRQAWRDEINELEGQLKVNE